MPNLSPIDKILYLLPENWTAGQIVAPNGTDVGLDETHGYNYLMRAVNAAIAGVNGIAEALPSLSDTAVTPLAVPASAWQADTSGALGAPQYSDYPYTAQVAVSAAAAHCWPVAALHTASLYAAASAGLCPAMRASAGKVQLWSAQPVRADLSLTLALTSVDESGSADGWGGILGAKDNRGLAAAQVGYEAGLTSLDADNVQQALDGLFGATLPKLVIQTEPGSTLSITDGSTILSGNAGVDGIFETWLPRLGTWIVDATLDAQSTSDRVEIEQLGRTYTIEMVYFSASLTVTAVPGAVVTASSADAGKSYTATAGADGRAELGLSRAGSYTVTAVRSGAASNSAVVEVVQDGGSYVAAVSFITLSVAIDAGSSITVTDGTTTLSRTGTGVDTFYLPNTGSWTVTATLDDQTAGGAVSADAYTTYSLELSYVKVFGVCWNYGASPTALSRLTQASDPHGYVNVDITADPVPAVGNGAGSSPFDAYVPWSGMEEYNIVNNAVGPKMGEAGFARTNDTVVKIPAYYCKVVDDAANQKRYFYIADKAMDGFALHPGSGKYLGRYNTASGYVSKTGAAPLVSITRAAARTGSKGKGSHWGQYDYATWCAVWLLYLVEFADWDSQAAIGRGYVDDHSSAIKSGGTDSMIYHTGRAAGTDGSTAVQYRHIENPWGNVFDFVDGINFSGADVYVCLDPDKYADDTATGYTLIGKKAQSDGYIKALGMSGEMPWAFFPSATGGSETTYIPDRSYYNSGWCVLHCGGHWRDGSYAGLFCFRAYFTASYSYSALGARLLYHP